ncbi:MAG: hypothetical protein EOS75_23495 [Mesorhizobium sp.]|nr:MAG: hypothetical protein EOS75_23495 [Mesorhizobium sp.]
MFLFDRLSSNYSIGWNAWIVPNQEVPVAPGRLVEAAIKLAAFGTQRLRLIRWVDAVRITDFMFNLPFETQTECVACGAGAPLLKGLAPDPAT